MLAKSLVGAFRLTQSFFQILRKSYFDPAGQSRFPSDQFPLISFPDVPTGRYELRLNVNRWRRQLGKVASAAISIKRGSW